MLLHPEVRRRFLSAAVQWISGAPYPPRFVANVELSAALFQGETHTLGGAIGWATKGRIWLAREFEPVRDVSGTPFDGRWAIEGLKPGQEIRALGPDGLRQLPDWRDLGLPRRVLLPTPAVWKGETLISAPLAGLAKTHAATLLRPSFVNWLSEH